MKSNELRRNNWVSEDVLGWVKVDWIQENCTGVIYRNLDYDGVVRPVIASISNDNLQSIELTPEILQKAGFMWSVYHQAFHKEGFPFDLNEASGGGWSMYTFKKSTHITSGLKHLHQLQNLFFCHTGEELPLNL